MAWPGWENFDPIRPEEPEEPPKKHKYNAKRTVLDGITFHSKLEANRWRELKLMQKAGEITELSRQVEFELTAMPRRQEIAKVHGFVVVGRYRADFTYFDKERRLVVEDAKGVRTALYSWKKKHFEIEYGIKITEV